MCLTVAAATVAVTAGVLLAMGRTLWGTAGQPGLWPGDIWSQFNSQRLADPYTLTHISHGLGLYGLLWLAARNLPVRVRGVLAVAIEAGWEVFENSDWVIQRYREATISLDYYGDSVINSTGDILTAALAARGRSTFSELRWYPPMEAAKGSLSWVFRAKQPESVRTGP